jgi:hypothetical protein
VGIITAVRTINPPMVGVPAFVEWLPTFLSSDFDCSPIWCFFSLRIITGPTIKLISRAVIAAKADLNVIYWNKPNPGGSKFFHIHKNK